MVERVLGYHDMPMLQVRARQNNLANTSKQMPAIVLIDMHHGCGRPLLDDRDIGVGKMREFAAAAKKKGIPVAIMEMEGYRTIPEIASLEKNGARLIYKTGRSAFSTIKFTEFLEQHNVNAMFVAGYNMVECVWATIEDAVKIGYQVYSSKDTLFIHEIPGKRLGMVIDNQLNILNRIATIYEGIGQAVEFLERISKENQG